MEQIKKQRPLPRLLRYARHRRKEIILGTAASILNRLFDLAPPTLIGAAVDIVVQQPEAGGIDLPLAGGIVVSIQTGFCTNPDIFAIHKYCRYIARHQLGSVSVEIVPFFGGLV